MNLGAALSKAGQLADSLDHLKAATELVNGRGAGSATAPALPAIRPKPGSGKKVKICKNKTTRMAVGNGNQSKP